MGNQDFSHQVIEVVKLIPAGRATSYGAIAKYLGTGLSSRMVGWVLKQKASQIAQIPAHRVVNRAGMLTGKHAFPSPTFMQECLESEGLSIENDGIQNWSEVFWDPAIELA